MNTRKYFSIESIKNNWFLIITIIVSAFLRLWQIGGYMIYLGDEGRDDLVVYNILHGHLTLLGPTSSVGGFFLGPFYYYLMAPFLWLSNYNPVGPSIMVAIFGVITTFLVYKMGEKTFSKKVGLISAFLYAISPIVIIYSHSSWNPNVMPFFTIATLYSLYFGLTKKNWKYIVLSGIFFGITMQLHYIEIFLSVMMFFYILLFYFLKKTFDIKKIVINYLELGVGFLIGFSPFIAFEVRHDFTNSLNILKFIFNSPSYTGTGSQIGTNVWLVFLRLFAGIPFNFPLSENFKNYNWNLVEVWMFFALVVGIASILLFLKRLRNLSKNIDNKFFLNLLMIIWLFFGIVLFAFYKKPIYDYYLEFLYPLPFILIANLCLFLFNQKKYFNVGKIVSGVIILVIIISSIIFSSFRNPPNQLVKQTKTISDFALSKTDGMPFNFALITGGNSDHAYRYFFKLADRDPVVIQYPGIDPQRTSVTSQLLVVCESLPCGPLGDSLWEIAGFGRASIAGHWKVSVVEVYRLVHYEGK